MTIIHDRNNTDIDIISKNVIPIPEDKLPNERCVLLTTGSFNPVHRSHIENLRKVRDYLTQPPYSMDVLAAYISPTHAEYVSGKLGSDYIDSSKRHELCREAIEEEGVQGFISVSTAEIDCPRGFVDFDQVTISLERFLNSSETAPELRNIQPIKVIYVCGLDHFNKCPHVAYLAERKNIACAVIYRHGASDHHIQQTRRPSATIYYIPLDENQSHFDDISSTAIRKHHQTGNYAELDRLTYPSVIKYYQTLPTSKNEQ